MLPDSNVMLVEKVYDEIDEVFIKEEWFEKRAKEIQEK